MTPKEAIEYLNIMKLSTEDDSVGEIKKEVCDMAIEALELYDKLKDEMSKRNMTVEHIIEYMKFEDECVEKGFTFKSLIEAREKRVQKFVDCPKGFQGVRDTRYYCPTCKALTRQHEPYCHKCGQSVKYPKEVYDKENNRIVFDWSEEE